jgi:hypothetical protein
VVRVRNVSARRLTVLVSTGQGPKAAVPLLVSPTRLEIAPGTAAEVTVRTPPLTVTHGEEATGTLTLTPVGGMPVRVPWAVVLRRGRGLLGPLSLAERAFSPSQEKPAVLVLRAGRVVRSPRGTAVVPVLRLDVEVWTADGGRVGLVARLRDLLPGRYAFGLTGHGPGGQVLPHGRYRLRVFAWPTGGGGPDTRSVLFTIR